MASRPSGAMMPMRIEASTGTAVSCAACIAPGWNAVIWLLSTSVMMIACAVKASSTGRIRSVRAPQAAMRATYSAPSPPTAAITTGWPPSWASE